MIPFSGTKAHLDPAEALKRAKSGEGSSKSVEPASQRNVFPTSPHIAQRSHTTVCSTSTSPSRAGPWPAAATVHLA